MGWFGKKEPPKLPANSPPPEMEIKIWREEEMWKGQRLFKLMLDCRLNESALYALEHLGIQEYNFMNAKIHPKHWDSLGQTFQLTGRALLDKHYKKSTEPICVDSDPLSIDEAEKLLKITLQTFKNAMVEALKPRSKDPTSFKL